MPVRRTYQYRCGACFGVRTSEKGRRKIITLCCVIVAVLGVAGYFTYRHYMDPIHAREAYDDAKRLIGVTRYPQAILAASTAILLKPDFADAYLLRAQANAAQRELESAESDFTHLIQLEPQKARGYAGRCEVYYDFKDYKKAIADCGKAIELEPSNARAFNLRGAALRETFDADKSLVDLNRAVALAPDVDMISFSEEQPTGPSGDSRKRLRISTRPLFCFRAILRSTAPVPRLSARWEMKRALRSTTSKGKILRVGEPGELAVIVRCSPPYNSPAPSRLRHKYQLATEQ